MWNHEGITGETSPPDIYQQCRGSLLILGAGRSLWSDLHGLEGYDFDDVMAVNFTAAFYPDKITHFATLEAEMASFCFELRKRIHHKEDDCVHVHINDHGHWHGGINWNMPEGIKHGTSGLFALSVGVCLGFDKIVIAGMPLNGDGRFFDPPNKDTGAMHYNDGHIRRTWEQFIHDGEWSDKVRACSGRTRSWLGEPTLEWFN
jgi:hypothetical protein